MCGIVGVVNKSRNGKPIGEKTLLGLRRAMAVQKHRGPDDDGVCAFRQEDIEESDDAIKLIHQVFDGAIGFNRLSIKDLSMAGHQPMISRDKKVILAFNGEIYNDAELRNMLIEKGYEFRSTSDTEVILNMYLEYGFERMISQLNGMFAVVIKDLRNDVFFMARDRFGIKPLYYSFCNDRLYFASELKCIIQFEEFKRELDLCAFNARILFARPSDKVLLKGVGMLDPGTAISMNATGEVHSWKYFNIDDYVRETVGGRHNKHHNIQEVLEEADAVFSDAVARQMVSDVKVGCQVSGGIDSTIVAYYANKTDNAGLNDGVSIIDDAGENGEEYYINHVGKVLGLKLHKFMPDETNFLENYQKLVWYNDAPIYKPFFSQYYQLTKGAKDYVTVLMSGEGADEIAGGYSRFPAGVYQSFLAGLDIGSKSMRSYKSYAEYAVLTDSTITGFTAKDLDNTQELIDEQIDIFNGFHGSNFMKHLKYETSQRLPESCMRQDKMSMANSIEDRVPLLDNKVVDFIMTIPEDMLVRFTDLSPMNLSDDPLIWVQGKYILKELCAEKFGRDFAYRKKAIMVFDDRKVLASDGFREMFYDLILPSMRRRDIVDAERIVDLYESIWDISMNDFKVMWRVISLETWCQLFLDANYI